jgi:aspartyl-tRNA(Asn)/glutamyl-tRNA(Gln) amidotransferase subunit A
MNIREAGAALRRRELSCVELTGRCLARIEELNPKLNAFITVTADAALVRARELDEELASGKDRGPLHGIPIAHKDLLDTRGVRTTCGSPIFSSRVPDRDAVVVERLAMAGAVCLGKLGMHELAYGITSENPHFGVVRNPYDPDRVPGGSSGGSGTAVSTGMAFMATGTDTGGSIRIPASFCGITGLKPTYGMVPLDGIQPLGLSLDHCGPMTRNVGDLALAFDAMMGRPHAPAPTASFAGIRAGVPENFFFDDVAPDVVASVKAAAREAEALGAVLVPLRLPDMGVLNAAARAILLAEATAIYRGHLDRPELFGADVYALLRQGLLVSGPDYVNAQRARRVLTGEYRRIFESVDCIVAPSTATTAPRIGERELSINGKVMDVRIATTKVARGVNALGFPALALPCGTSAEGLPIGLQIIAAPFREDLLLRVGAALETALNLSYGK